ncbi:Major Facilitator Superfamily protein [Streptococcus parasanguinis]|uniref:MFS transporter n=1 Tax=Streptococcus parasanguinis TaxID=1318 RepID=UPI001961E08E|nr:MFS transporter [Streptococcus parasanguinis]VTY28393.1 Major Facilitator Superfamily protein [Streptococcus parasanguinis]
MSKKNIILLISRGQTNNFGNRVYDYANKIFIAALPKSSVFFMSIYQSTEVIAQIFFNLIGGFVADFGNRKKILILTDIIAAISTFVAFLFLDMPNSTIVLIIVNIILAILNSFNNPAYKAIVRDLLDKNSIYIYNSYSRSIAEIFNIIVPFFGIWIISLFGFKVSMLLNSLSFVISAIIESKFAIKRQGFKDQKTAKKADIMKSIIEGFCYILQRKEFFIILILVSVLNFFVAGIELYLPFINKFLNVSYMYGYILEVQTIGKILGAYINKFFKNDFTMSECCNFLLMSSIALVPIAFINNIYLIILLFGISSLFIMIFDVQIFSKIQSEISEEFLGRVFSTVSLLSLVLSPVGTFVFSILKFHSAVIFSIIALFQVLFCIFIKILLSFVNSKLSSENEPNGLK